MTLVEPERRTQVVKSAPRSQRRNAKNLAAAPIKRMSAKDAVENIQKASKKIREYSTIIRDTGKTFRESGAVPELIDAMRDIASVVRDTANDIHETATELKESGVTGEIARSIEVTSKAAQGTIQTVRDAANILARLPNDQSSTGGG